MNRENEIIKARENGLTYKEIGERFGITGSRVRKIIRRHERNQELLKNEGFRLFYENDLRDAWRCIARSYNGVLYKLPPLAYLKSLDYEKLMSIKGIGKQRADKIIEILKHESK